MNQSPSADPLSLGQKLVAVLEGGRRTSTYKLATILALLDLAVESVPENPDAAVDIDLDALSERVLAMYWRQIRPIEGVQIRQSSDGRSAILAIVETLRNSAGVRDRVGSPAVAEAADPNGYREAVEAIKVTLVRYPLQLLQRVNNAEHECFLYDDSWMDTTSLKVIENAHGNAIRLLPGVASALARLAPLLRPAFQLAWITDVRRMNAWLQEDGPDLAAHLFGSDRVSLIRVRDVLREGFGSRCFYCDRTISDVPQVDHVLPWSRVPIDGLANLVLACRSCNGDKSDLLPIPDHHHRAMARGHATLDELASSINWPSQYIRVKSAARGIYATTPSGTPLWRAARDVRLSSRIDLSW